MIATIGTTTQISYAHRLRNHPGKCKILHGHNSNVTVTVTGEVDSVTGMVIDFSEVKNIVKGYDHQTLLEFSDPLAEVLSTVQPILTLFGPPTAENIARDILYRVCKLGNFESITVAFSETDNCEVFVEWVQKSA